MSTVVAVILILSLLIVYSVDWIAEQIPYSVEQSMVKQLDEKFSSRNEVDDYLQSIANQLKPVMGLADDVQIKVHYINENTVNAMTSLGGHIFVYRGLLKKLHSENAIVMLLGHEMAHVKYRHALKGLGKGIILSAVFSLILGQAADVSADLVNGTGQITLLKFSRDQEQACDELALASVEKIYGHVAGSDDLFLSLQTHANAQAEFLSSHPNIQNRLDNLQQLAARQKWSKQGKLKVIPENIRNKIADFRSR